VSPALNINLSSVLFTSVISGTKGETGAEYKLTLLDNNMTIAGGDVTRSGDAVTIPYTISGTNSGNVNRISVLITDKVYTDSNAQILHYGSLDTSAGNGTFALPAELSDKVCGTDYYAYIIAEDVNGNYKTDYASTPVSITVPAKPWEAPTVNAINIGTPGIIDPAVPTSTSDAWKGCYVYFGTYGGNPVKYRVLDKNTTVFGGTTMLLDCDSILWAGTNGNNQSSAFDDDSNVWANSNIKTYLNGTFLTSNFSTAEQNAIASSTKSAAYSGTDGADGNGRDDLSYVPLSNDKIFFLDAKEATNTSYGYSNTNSGAENRKKTGGNAYWWLRSAKPNDTIRAGRVGSVGFVGYSHVNYDFVGVSPAFNINLSSVLFSSVSGTSKSSALTAASSQIGETTGTEWKLTLADTGKTVQVIEDKKVIKAADGTITVPYTYTDAATAEAEKVNQISVMITDKAYAAEGAKILYYGALQNIKDANGSASIVSDAATGTGTFELPGGLTGTLGTDYHVYILAEHVNENSNATDYASTPVEITAMYNTIESDLTDNRAAEKKEADDTAAAKKVTDAINALPASDKVATTDKAAIEAARKAYDALTADQKKKVPADVLKKLTDAETALKAAEKKEAEDAANAATAKKVVDAINKLPVASKVTVPNKAAIEAARKAYNSLTAEQKKNVPADVLKKLTDDEKALAAATAADKAAKELAAAKEEAQAAMNEQVTVTQKGKKFTVKWKKSTSADGYYVYASYCGKKATKPAKTIKKNTTTKVTISKINGKKISTKKNFHVYVVPYKIIDGKKVALGKSTVVHLVGAKSTKYSNVKKLTLKKTKYTVKVGKTAKIKAKVTLVNKNKKHIPKSHGAKFRYKSSDTSIATVDKNGKIKGIKKGKCTIYVYSINGLTKKAQITVK